MSPTQPISEETANRLITEVLAMKGEVVLIKAQSRDTHKRLFGNGQPGELATLESKINTQGDWITRADEREKTNRKWTAGIATAFGVVSGAIGHWLAKHLG